MSFVNRNQDNLQEHSIHSQYRQLCDKLSHNRSIPTSVLNRAVNDPDGLTVKEIISLLDVRVRWTGFVLVTDNIPREVLDFPSRQACAYLRDKYPKLHRSAFMRAVIDGAKWRAEQNDSSVQGIPHRKVPYLGEGTEIDSGFQNSTIRLYEGRVNWMTETTIHPYRPGPYDRRYPGLGEAPEMLIPHMLDIMPDHERYGIGRPLLLTAVLSMYLTVSRGMELSFPILAMPRDERVPVLLHRVIDPSTEICRVKPASQKEYIQAIHERDIPVFRVGRGVLNSAGELIVHMREAGYGSVPMVLWKGMIKEGERLLRYVPDHGRPLDASWPNYHRVAAEVDAMAPDIFHGLLEQGAYILHRWWNSPVDERNADAHDFIRWVALAADQMDLDNTEYDALMAAMNECVTVIDGSDELLIRL